MNEVAFVERREPDWKRLSYLVDRADASVRQLTSQELREFIRLFRRVSGDLALARTQSVNLELIEFLNDLVARAYSTIYTSPRRPLGRSIVEGIALAAQAVRRLRWFVLASATVFFGSAVWGYFVLSVRPDTRKLIIGSQFREIVNDWKSGKFPEATGEGDVAATSFYWANNPTVAIITGAEAAGSFGIITAQSLYNNGVILGALMHELQPVGQVHHLLYSIDPHGVTELSGIVLSGAAGFSLGWALICPGRRKRGEALAHAAKDALVVLATSVVLMFMAAPIEGFFSFNPHVPNWCKAAFAGASALAWAAFWIGFGRREEAEVQPTGHKTGRRIDAGAA
jgi:uncharacterized membrane protein SpoIIM required for sporulation